MILNTTIAFLILSSSARMNSNKTMSYPELVNHSLVIEVVTCINKLYEFKTYVFFLSDGLASETDMTLKFLKDFRNNFATAPFMLIISNSTQMSGFSSSYTLCFILTTAVDDPIMEVAALSMKGIRYMKTIFIFYPLRKTLRSIIGRVRNDLLYNEINLIYKWVWRKQFLNTLLITERNNIYIHVPYPTASVVNKTLNWTAADCFEDYSPNFKGYPVKAIWHHDLPTVFRMTRVPLGRKNATLSGVAAKIFLAFIEQVNATFNDTVEDKTDMEAVDRKELFHFGSDEIVEIVINLETALIPALVWASYPVDINDWCIMVPHQNQLPERKYVQGALHIYSWYLLLFSIVYITFGIWLCTPSSERDLSLSFLQSICSIVLIVPLRFFTLPYVRLRFLFVLLFVMGFFISQMYMSKIISCLTTPTTQKQIDNIEDVIEANLSIMMMDYEYEKVRLEKFPQKFLDLIIIKTKSVLDKHRDGFKSSFGYSSQTDRWSFLNKQQLGLMKPLFRISSICMGPYHRVFPLQQDSHLAKPLHNFILLAHQHGLMIHWESEAFLDALFMNYVSIIMIDLHPIPLTMTYFHPVWFVWWLGIILAGLSFVLEVKGFTLNVIMENVIKFVRWLRIKRT